MNTTGGGGGGGKRRPRATRVLAHGGSMTGFGRALGHTGRPQACTVARDRNRRVRGAARDHCCRAASRRDVSACRAEGLGASRRLLSARDAVATEDASAAYTDPSRPSASSEKLPTTTLAAAAAAVAAHTEARQGEVARGTRPGTHPRRRRPRGPRPRRRRPWAHHPRPHRQPLCRPHRPPRQGGMGSDAPRREAAAEEIGSRRARGRSNCRGARAGGSGGRASHCGCGKRSVGQRDEVEGAAELRSR